MEIAHVVEHRVAAPFRLGGLWMMGSIQMPGRQ